MEGVPLIIDDLSLRGKLYEIKRPDIESGSTYYFQTGSGLKYQVTFGKKKNNYLGNILNFSVLSEEYEDEYSETNRGEVFAIIRTMVEIVRIYHDNHPYSNSYEFSGEFKDTRDSDVSSIRTKLYFREAKRVIDQNFWNLLLEGNKVIITRKAL
jgi:hypothetical protein